MSTLQHTPERHRAIFEVLCENENLKIQNDRFAKDGGDLEKLWIELLLSENSRCLLSGLSEQQIRNVAKIRTMVAVRGYPHENSFGDTFNTMVDQIIWDNRYNDSRYLELMVGELSGKLQEKGLTPRDARDVEQALYISAMKKYYTIIFSKQKKQG